MGALGTAAGMSRPMQQRGCAAMLPVQAMPLSFRFPAMSMSVDTTVLNSASSTSAACGAMTISTENEADEDDTDGNRRNGR